MSNRHSSGLSCSRPKHSRLRDSAPQTQRTNSQTSPQHTKIYLITHKVSIIFINYYLHKSARHECKNHYRTYYKPQLTYTCFLWFFLASHTINVPTVPAPPTALPAGIVSAPPPTIFDQQQHPPATADILASVGGTPQAKANKKRKSDWSEGTAGNP